MIGLKILFWKDRGAPPPSYLPALYLYNRQPQLFLENQVGLSQAKRQDVDAHLGRPQNRVKRKEGPSGEL